MKKVFYLLIILIGMTSFTYGQDVKEATSAVHQDVVKGTSAVYSDATKATSTVYKDATDAISVVHQDLKDVVTTTYPDAKGVVTTLYQDGKKAIDYLVPKVESVITALAEGLKTTTAEVWRILVYKQVALAVTALIYFTISLILVLCYVWGVNKVLNAVKTMNGYWKESQTAFVIIGGIVSAGLAFFMAIQIPVMVNGFIVPEAGAFQEVIGLTEKLIGSFK